ncbi:unnamed protein product [Meganyctiphanes norvegica]|uniref:Uncharacterized protein n=1 Tax=Meganyctiphanes norvegica TaxID=48144 RepID=A0AAV2S4H0_MEGNR
MDEVDFASQKLNHKKERVLGTSSCNSDKNCLEKSKEYGAISHSASTITTYPQRFWVLTIFSILAWFQCCQWNTWGPINQSVMVGYGWGSDTVAMMGNWGTISFVLFVTPMCWLTTRYGLRFGVLACSGLIAFGTALRCVTMHTTAFTILSHIAAICIGTAGPVILSAPPMLAADWFPTKERTTATAIALTSNGLGGLGSYLEPLIVRSPGDNVTQDEIKGDIRKLMFIYAGFGALLFISIAIYFPSRPPTPPSISSKQEKLSFKDSTIKILSNKATICILMTYSIGVGIPFVWASVWNFSFNSLGINQNEAMWIGLVQQLSCGIAGILMGRVTDIFYGYIRGSIIILFLASAGFFYWFFLLTSGTIPMAVWQVYVIIAISLGLIQGASVLTFELAVEAAYPCSEVIVGGILSVGSNFIGLIFLMLFLFPFSGYNWVTYLLLGSSFISVIPLLFINDRYNRSKIDRSDIL